MSRMNKKALGTRIRELRKARTWNQADLAEKAGVANRSIQQIESGEANPQLDTLLDIETALNEAVLVLSEASALRRPSDDQLRGLIVSPHDVRHQTVSAVLSRLLHEDPSVRAAALAVIYGDPAIARLNT